MYDLNRSKRHPRRGTCSVWIKKTLTIPYLVNTKLAEQYLRYHWSNSRAQGKLSEIVHSLSWYRNHKLVFCKSDAVWQIFSLNVRLDNILRSLLDCDNNIFETYRLYYYNGFLHGTDMVTKPSHTRNKTRTVSI